MARAFDHTLNQYLSCIGSPVATIPATFSAWMRQTNEDVCSTAFCCTNTITRNCLTFGQETNVTNNRAFGSSFIMLPRNAFSDGTTPSPLGEWAHVAAVFENATSRHAFLHGGDKGSNGVPSTPVGMTHTYIGVLNLAGYFNYMRGDLAECAVWNVALTDDEIVVLAEGYSPLLVHPESLVAYWPLGGLFGNHDHDIVGGYDMTSYNAPTWANHPPVIYPSRGKIVYGMMDEESSSSTGVRKWPKTKLVIGGNPSATISKAV